MTRKDFMRFVVWAMQQKDEGKHLSVCDVMTHCEVSRATAYRLLADYFDARCWQWPRPVEAAMPRVKGDGGEHPWMRDRRLEIARRAQG